MLLTVFYMLATWIQSWRLSSLRGRLQAILLESEVARPSVMLYTASQLSIKDESNNGACCSKSLNGNGNGNGKSKHDLLSSHLCSNSNIAKLGDLLWYQGDKRLCTIYPQQKIDVSSWLLYPYGRTIFPLFTHNNSQTSLLQDTKLHVLIEADLKKFIPLAFTKATKLEDYGTIVAWTSDDIFAVILETDLEHITKFSTTLMQGQCFINNGLPVTRIESVSVSGKPCVCNYERFNFSESRNEAKDDKWMDQANLVIVCGNVGADVGAQLVEYIVRGGKLLALCSDILKTLLPAFKTAEVRENELVRFSYGKWQHVRMMHHVFCYQASPVKTKFSHDQEDSGRSATPPTPISTTIVDRQGKSHTFGVRVLGSEETWHTPSILLADQPESGGKAVFSQIHLEADPSQYELEESKFNALKQSNSARLEIFADLLANHLGMHVNSKPRVPPVYTPGFFLGKHENLSTQEIGRLVIYTDTLTSTYDVVQDLELHHGLAVVSRLQTRGQDLYKLILIFFTLNCENRQKVPRNDNNDV
ncbi:unnamed protein product [Trichogramma brassicae]|uniref:Uncharacterized protein n=1 Tax=Trichogramma brassicae TaxID=86971 RepID=A0A6H5IFS3_9HYME|nr:unnamed protein product [Trichogramma brassicae]